MALLHTSSMCDGDLWWIPWRSQVLVDSSSNVLGGSICSVIDNQEDAVTRLVSALGADKRSFIAVHNVSGSEASVETSAPSRNAKPFVFTKGQGFAGQVFGLYSTSRSCLVGVEEKRYLRNLPFLQYSFVNKLLSKLLKIDNTKGPSFNFYISQEDAGAYLKRLKVPDMEVGSVPLHLAYKFFKERPTLFNFVPSKRQVNFAKDIIKRTQGVCASRQFKGVPIFSSQNLSILVVSPTGARWFRPHFFKKEELDGIIKSSMEHHYQSVIRNRSARRHNQLGDLSSDISEDDLEMLESQDMQDFMEDMDEWGSILESIMAKAAQIYFQDSLDKAIFGNKWCRMIAGIQPKFSILVDSFERRVTMEAESMDYGRTASPVRNPKRKWLLSKLMNSTDEDESSNQAPHLTVVAGIPGSSPDSVIKAASAAIEDAKDRIGKNEMPLESLFIADLGGPHVWANPSAGFAGLGSNSDE